MAFTITTIRRAVFFSTVSSAYRAQLPPLSEVWQSVQFKLKEAAKNPMVPKNWSTEIPRSTWIFLKASSAICGFSACPCAQPMASRHMATVPALRIAPLDPNFMSPPLLVVLPRALTANRIARTYSLASASCCSGSSRRPSPSWPMISLFRLDTIHSPALPTQSAPEI